MSGPVEFSFPRERLLLLGICLLVLAILLFGAGVATGLYIGSGQQHAALLDQMRQNAAPPPQKTTPVAAPKAEPAAAAHQTSTPTGPPEADTVAPGIALEISGLEASSRATQIAGLLDREGYGPARIASYRAGGHLYYAVRLGPYDQWERAARIAGELRSTFNLQSSLLPSRAHS